MKRKLVVLVALFCVFGLAKEADASINNYNNNLPSADFVDVASWQGYLSIKDYQVMKESGIKGVVIKVSEGTHYVNPYAKDQIENAKLAGLKVSVYHYSRYKNKHEASAEAEFFYKKAISLGITSEAVFVNDAEDTDLIRSSKSMVEEAGIFRRTLKELGAKFTDIYLSAYWKSTYINPDSIGERGWIASYPNTPSKLQTWYSSRNAWQWSSNYSFIGIPGKLFDICSDYSGLYTEKIENIEVELDESEPINTELYTVKSGDNLWTIGIKMKKTWREIASFNNLTVPYTIYPGQQLVLSKSQYHIVRYGDCLSKIADKYNIKLSVLLNLNGQIHNPNLIRVGDIINLK